MNIVDQRPPHEGPLDDTIDPRSSNEEATTGPREDLVDLLVDNKEPTKVLKVMKTLSSKLREAISTFLKENLDVFTWKHSDMEGIHLAVMCHHLNLDSDKNLIILLGLQIQYWLESTMASGGPAWTSPTSIRLAEG